LFPTVPFRILSLGGTKVQAGLFLGFITYASAFSAPFGGAVADRLGKRSVLLAASWTILLLSAAYGIITSLWLMLLLALIHGIFWSALLTASAALMTDIIPAARRTEGISTWGLATVLAIAVAPSFGLFLFHYGWHWVCGVMSMLSVGMVLIAYQVPTQQHSHSLDLNGLLSGGVLNRALLVLSITLFLYSFGYGGMTSFVALYTQEAGIRFKGIYFLVFAVTVLFTRPFLGRMADRWGRKRILLPCLGLIAVGMSLLAVSARLPSLILSAIIFGTGFGSAYPAFAAYVLERVNAGRTGAAFGTILLAFDTGIGSGSMLFGTLIQHFGYRIAFGTAAALALCSIPYFLTVENRLDLGG
jgi:MFS family permease